MTSKKKRRTFKRKSRRTTMAWSRKTENPVNPFRFTGRKISKAAWRRRLWNDSQTNTHYRSVFNQNQTTNTPANITQISVQQFPSFEENNAIAFWKVAGGLQDPSFGIAPTFGAAPGAGVPEPISIILRGGRIFCTLSNPSLTDTVQVRIQFCYPKQQSRNRDDNNTSNTLFDYLTTLFASGSKPWSWSVRDFPDWSEYFHPMLVDKVIDLEPGGNVTVVRKLRCTKIDVQQFLRGGGAFPYWITTCGQQVDNTAGAQPISVRWGHNISFSVMDTNQS